jgi:prepilin-type N-terminal cleavage/methylation domain-containing protein
MMAADRGFTLVEVLIAMTLLCGAIVSLAQLSAVATASNHVARKSTVATLLAVQKIEALRALEWTVAGDGRTFSDTTSNTAALLEPSATGTGLTQSPPESLERDVDGYVDYVDGFGRVLAGSPAPEGTVFVRRWSIRPLGGHELNTLVIQVFVTPNPGRVRSGTEAWRRLKDEAWLVSLKTRKASS